MVVQSLLCPTLRNHSLFVRYRTRSSVGTGESRKTSNRSDRSPVYNPSWAVSPRKDRGSVNNVDDRIADDAEAARDTPETKAEATKARIVDAAEQVFGARGYYNTS